MFSISRVMGKNFYSYARAYWYGTGGVVGTVSGLMCVLGALDETTKHTKINNFSQMKLPHKAAYLAVSGTTILSVGLVGGMFGFILGPFLIPMKMVMVIASFRKKEKEYHSP